jgi:hypothetical protein
MLGIPEGTPATRLAKARRKLRVRLSQRGVTLSAAVLMAVLTVRAVAQSASPMLQSEMALNPAGFAPDSSPIGGLIGRLKLMFSRLGYKSWPFFCGMIIGTLINVANVPAEPSIDFGSPIIYTIVGVSDSVLALDDQEGWVKRSVVDSDPCIAFLRVNKTQRYVRLDRPLPVEMNRTRVFVRYIHDESGRPIAAELLMPQTEKDLHNLITRGCCSRGLWIG